MNKSIARIKLASAVRNRDKLTVKNIMDWASANLSNSAFATMFVKDLKNYPDKDRQWFRDEFELICVDFSTGEVARLCYQ